jgi:hypothetical protein
MKLHESDQGDLPMLELHEDGRTLLIAPCYACGRVFASNPATVDVILVDPSTNLPIEIEIDPGSGKPRVKPGGPTGQARARASRAPICPECAHVIRRDGQMVVRITPSDRG